MTSRGGLFSPFRTPSLSSPAGNYGIVRKMRKVTASHKPPLVLPPASASNLRPLLFSLTVDRRVGRGTRGLRSSRFERRLEILNCVHRPTARPRPAPVRPSVSRPQFVAQIAHQNKRDPRITRPGRLGSRCRVGRRLAESVEKGEMTLILKQGKRGAARRGGGGRPV